MEQEKNSTPTGSVVRKFIHPAIYIESSNNGNPIQQSSDKNSQLKIKKSVCVGTQEKSNSLKPKSSKISTAQASSSSKSSLKTDSGFNEEIRRAVEKNKSTEEIQQLVYDNWLTKKNRELLIKQLMTEKSEKEKELERLKKQEVEKENFKHWLVMKKKEEEKKKLEKQRKEQEEMLKSARPKRNPEEKEMHLQAWLKRKEKETLGLYFRIFLITELTVL